MNDLKNLSQIFDRRLLRIPDYQRGYAWQRHELKYFWEDLINLQEGRIHYTGVITLEPLGKEETNKSAWEDDAWIIKDGYKPYYVVDGQQRLTTSIILIQTILDMPTATGLLNNEPIEDHFQKYILKVKENSAGLQRSFIFGYAEDGPSFEYLKTQIFAQPSFTNDDKLTLYTKNLKDAKVFFREKLTGMSPEAINQIFEKITEKFKFNLYEVVDDDDDDKIDVFVTFETMNNRGKSLSCLEILKNRLIYLSTLYEDDKSCHFLRKNINESWKTIYKSLGENPDKPLDDDLFLRNHWRMFFKYIQKPGHNYKEFLLDKRFTTQNVLSSTEDKDHVRICDISEYVKSLQEAAPYWFYIHNPYAENTSMEGNSENRVLLHKLERLGFYSFEPLILAAYCAGTNIEEINKFKEINELLDSAERYNFILFTLSQRRANTGAAEFFRLAHDLLKGDVSIDVLVKKIEEWITGYYSAKKFQEHINYLFLEGKGFYDWRGLRYFLYEYEEELKRQGRHAQPKLTREFFKETKKDHVSIEHIYPQTETEEWADIFSDFSDKDKPNITHSLGNLLPLSRSKNSKLQNKPFGDKKDDGEGCGYFTGSCSENEVNKSEKWDFEKIRDRGFILLEFMERRWKIKLGDKDFKTKLLGLSFKDNIQVGPLEEDIDEAVE